MRRVMGKMEQHGSSVARRLVPPLWLFVVLAGGAVLAVMAWVRLPPVPGEAGWLVKADERATGMVLTAPPRTEEEEDSVREELALLDPTPLFLPTRWTSGGAVAARGVDQEPGTTFRDFGAWLVFSDKHPTTSLRAGAEPPEGALAALALIEDPARRMSIALGRRDGEVPRLPARAGRLEVIAAGDGRTRLELALVLPAELVGEDWAPVEFIALVDVEGLVGRPMALGSTGSERLDAALPALLARDRRIGVSLGAGSYRLVVGP